MYRNLSRRVEVVALVSQKGELVFIAQHVVLSSIWRGDFGEATLVAEDVMERARQLGGDTPLFLALGLRTKLAVYAGREADAPAGRN